MARLVIRLLGGFEAVLDGRPVAGFESDKVRALLAYLAVHAGRPQRREIVAALLWPESPEGAARASLRNALANLRRAVGDHQALTPFLAVSRQTVAVNRSAALWLDVAEFKQAVQNSIAAAEDDRLYLEEAIALYRGPLLDGFSVASIPFQEWLLPARERLNRQMVEAMRRLAACYAESGQFDAALDYAWRQVELEPWEEAGQRLLIRLLAASGRRSEALAQYAHCCVLLRETLDIEPSAETAALHKQILAGDVPSISTLPPNNLPLWHTPLIGRAHEIAWVHAQLDNHSSRLITLIGPGGIGKTHLALAAVKARLNLFPDGVFLLSLAAEPFSQSLIPSLAKVLDLPPQEKRDLTSQLIDYLRPKSLLLLLDSFEYLIAAPGLASQTGSQAVSRLLQEAPRLKFLVTSQIPLNLHGEQTLPLEGLDCPPQPAEEQAIAAADSGNYGAVSLFIDHARHIRPHYTPTTVDIADIGHICRQVEGMPLAILLAAAWIELLSPREIAAEIARDIDFLTMEASNIPRRHRSLRAVFNNAWRLLSTEEQAILKSLSVFRGGFTRSAAQMAAGAPVHILRTLVSRSLLLRLRNERYSLHPTLRHYAAEKLAETPQMHADIRDEHCTFFASFSQAWVDRFNGEYRQAAIAEMGQEFSNLQIAWRWALAKGALPLLLQMVEALCAFHFYHGRLQEGLRASHDAGGLAAEDQSATGLLLKARSLAWQSAFHTSLGQLDQATKLSQECLVTLEHKQLAAHDTRRERAFALLQMARQLTQSNLQKAMPLGQESLILYRALADRRGMAEALDTAGQAAWLTADYSNARDYLQECLQLRGQLNDVRGMVAVLGTLGFVFFQMGKFQQAESLIREGIGRRQQMGDLAGAADALFNLAMAMIWLGEFAQVNKLLEPAVASFNESGAISETVRLQALQVMALALSGRTSDASPIAEQSLAYARSNGLVRETGILLWVLGFLSVASAEYDKAEAQLLQSMQLSESVGLWDILAAAQVARGYAALGLKNLAAARSHFVSALQRRQAPQSNGVALLALPGIALLVAQSGLPMRAQELYSLAARFPLVANSPFFASVAGQPPAASLADVPQEVGAQASADEQPLDLETALPALLKELDALQIISRKGTWAEDQKSACETSTDTFIS